LSHLFEIVKNKLRVFFIREKAQRGITASADEDRMADFCIAAIQGAMLMGKIKRSPLPVKAAVAEALAHLRHQIAPPDPPADGAVEGEPVARQKSRNRGRRR